MSMKQIFESYNWGSLFPHNSSAGAYWLELQINDTVHVDMDTYGFVRFRFPILLCLGYVASVLVSQPKKDVDEKNVKSAKGDSSSKPIGSDSSEHWTNQASFKAFVFVHNMALCIFSAMCFYQTFPVMYRLIFHTPLTITFCQGWAEVFDGPFGYWSWLFYLSKYWEFVDTWLLIAKGRRPIFLQVFFMIFFFCPVGNFWRKNYIQKKSYTFAIFFLRETQKKKITTVEISSRWRSVFMLVWCGDAIEWILSVCGVEQLYSYRDIAVGWSCLVAQLYFFTPCLRKEDVVSSVYVLWYITTLFFMFRQFYHNTYNTPKQIKKE
ncbi:hypothetical protein RFI_02431 [Reticulomyxa filosa]|uniref:Elongation of fatty acids protein n=1 Tax=Reticulomyxa filosa TaxID=46433 RepID=X6P968_RETFI|nr:hypothetical protein RFI_02431 [Reticulomyxa filosa]|eukprot:ETO34658.1 hypothetical protein RFI_02431 [Reticulomyxa filosa]